MKEREEQLSGEAYKRYNLTVNSMVMNYFYREEGRSRRNTEEEIERQ